MEGKIYAEVPALDLGTIEVIGQKYPRMNNGSFASGEVIGRQEIKSSQQNEISSYLEENVNIGIHSGGTGFVSGLTIRGISGGTKNNKTKIWLNGVPVNTLRRGFVLEALPVNSVERIDIIKGPSSVLYGGGALNGSINIVSVIPAGESYDLTYERGSYNKDRAAFSLQKRTENFAYSGDISYTDTAGFIEDTDSGDKINPAVMVKGGVSGEYSLGRNVFSLHGRKFNALKDSPNFSFRDGSLRTVEENISTDMGIYSLSWDRTFSKFKTSLRGFLNRETEKSDITDRESSLNAGGVGEFSAQLGNNVNTVAGYDWENLCLYRENKDDYYQRRMSPFVQLTYTIPSGPAVTAGGRYSINSEFSSRFSPKFGLSWEVLNNLNLYTTASQGYRPPTVKELHSKDLNYFGDPNLEPENSMNYEGGMKYAGRLFSLKVSAFEMEVKDIIVNQPPQEDEYYEGDKIIKKVQNIPGRSPYRGMEIGGRVNLSDEIYFNSSYNYLDPGDLTFHTDGHRVKARLGYRSGRHDFYLASISAFERYLWDYSQSKRDDYTVINLKYGIDLGGGFTLYARADNIGGEEYHVYFYQPVPGRNYSAGLNISF